jgi:hypothetical protein
MEGITAVCADRRQHQLRGAVVPSGSGRSALGLCGCHGVTAGVGNGPHLGVEVGLGGLDGLPPGNALRQLAILKQEAELQPSPRVNPLK